MSADIHEGRSRGAVHLCSVTGRQLQRAAQNVEVLAACHTAVIQTVVALEEAAVRIEALIAGLEVSWMLSGGGSEGLGELRTCNVMDGIVRSLQSELSAARTENDEIWNQLFAHTERPDGA